ncbi:cytochrome c oxidase assembly protein COX18, mitochondrial [Haematobia irritans]|uniref:cytochrome c oxidase assembly protein COX18, mitochondrial n=1 Tax=Haematobia irritans TaxID=7368 RepID=UPI003F4FFCA5
MSHLFKPFACKSCLLRLSAKVDYVKLGIQRNFGSVSVTQARRRKILDIDKDTYATKSRRYNSTDISNGIQIATASSPPMDIGFFASVYQSLSTSTPVSYMQQGLIEIHDFTGLSWWLSIVASTFLFRSVVTLPLTIYQHKITARIEKISLEMPAIVEELKKEAAMAMRKFKWTEQQTKLVYQRSIKKQWTNLIVRDNCHPAKTFIVLWGQIPLWIFQSMALRNMINMLPDPTSLQAQIVVTEMTIGGFGWIPNLTMVDSSYILPVALGLLNLGIIEMQSMLRTRPSTRFQNIITNVFRGLSICMVPVACSVPSGLTVYWVASSTYGLVQNLVLASPRVKRALGIPKTKSELENPYEHIWMKIKQRTGLEKTSSVQNTFADAVTTKDTSDKTNKPRSK